MCSSVRADSMGVSNTPPPAAKVCLEQLVDYILDPLREWYGKPIRVTSGYRCQAINRSVNGSTSSQHIKGQAADISVGSPRENKRLYEYIRDCLPFDQLINEYNYQWVHVSFSKGCNRRMQLSVFRDRNGEVETKRII